MAKKTIKSRYAQSEKLFEEARKLMPGGVSSPVRSFKSVGMSPVFIKDSKGACLFDADGNQYIDYVMSYGPLIAGHAPPSVRAAVAKQMDKGSSYGCCTEAEVKLAALIAAAMPNVPMVRFVNSGTEALMSAIRLARGVSKRDVIVKCAGCYHGHVDSMLVQAGSGATTHGQPSSPGVPASVTQNTAIVPYNDLDAAAKVFAELSGKIAAMVVEPVCGNIGVVLPDAGYLQGLRDLCDKHGVLLIFDEVMTGFRVAYGGVQALYGVRPDITCLGKIIGGGLPVGAYGGSAEIMNNISPAGPIYQAGTLSGNPLAMSAGIATLELLEEGAVYTRLESLGARLEAGLAQAGAGCRHSGRGAALRQHDHPVFFGRTAGQNALGCRRESGWPNRIRGDTGHPQLRRRPAMRHRRLCPLFPRDARRRRDDPALAIRILVHQQRPHRRQHRRHHCQSPRGLQRRQGLKSGDNMPACSGPRCRFSRSH